MDPKYNIGDLLNQAFGIDNAIAGTGGYKGVTMVEDVAEVHRQSYLGTPIIYPLILKGQRYQIYTDTGEIDTQQVREFELPAVALSSFSRKKNISQTRLNANYGTVKEMYGFDDWKIEIRGLCLRDPKHPSAQTAFEQHLRLLEFEKVAESIPVISDLYNDKGIDTIVIESIKFDQIAGKPGVIPFRISAISDTPTELIL